VQTCTRCNHQNADAERFCQTCGADLWLYSNHAVALKKFKEDPSVTHVRIAVGEDACPACQQARGSYALDQAPQLPIPGCSHAHGCRCHYEPWLSEIHP
jgi:hypothetical protein